MRKNPCIVLVCLLFIAVYLMENAASAGSFIKISIDNGPTAQKPPERLTFIPASAPGYQRPMGVPPMSVAGPITKCRPTGCEVPAVCGFDPGPPCFLPSRNCGQWELSAQAFFTRVRGKVSWPMHPTVDFNDDLGLDCHKTFFEYGARYQFRPNWAIIYSVMPIEVEAQYMPSLFPGTLFKSKWETFYQRVGLMYQPIRTCSGALSIYNSWVLYDEKLTMHSGNVCAVNRAIRIDRTKNMVMSGIELQKCIRTMCNGGSFSCDTRVGIAYLDGTFGIDVQAGLQFSVPMNCGRYGYAKGGYRLINFKEDRIDHRIDTFLSGWFAELGLVF